MGTLLLLPGRKYQGSEQYLSDMDGLDSVRVHGIRQLHLYLLNLQESFVIPCLNLLNLMRCSESVKEIDKRNLSFQCCTVCELVSGS